MKIKLLKKVTTESGKVLSKGITLTVTNEYGKELIEAGKAVNEGMEIPIEIEEQTNKLD
jgi:hypothetical protein